MFGTGLATRFGILIKGGGEAIEMAYRLDYGELDIISYGLTFIIL